MRMESKVTLNLKLRMSLGCDSLLYLGKCCGRPTGAHQLVENPRGGRTKDLTYY